MNRQPTAALRRIVFGLSLILAVGAAAYYGQVTDHYAAAAEARILCFFLLGIAMFGLVFSWPAIRKIRGQILTIIGISVLLRVGLFFAAPSDDIYRYLWEGRLILDGVSPYQDVAESEYYDAYKNDLWEQMNHKERLTAYPPLSQYLFAVIYVAGPNAYFFKLIFILLDIAAILLIIKLLINRSLPIRWAGFYAFNPVILASFAAEGHFDIGLVVFLLLTALAIDQKRFLWACALLAMAVQFKIIALIGLPFLFKKAGFKGMCAFAGASLLIALPYLGDLPALISALLGFGGGSSFNGIVHDPLFRWTRNRELVNLFVLAGFLSVYAVRLFLSKKDDWVSDWIWVCGALLIFSPIVHFWYLSWLLPFIALRPSLAWLLFSVMQGIYFSVWLHAEETYWRLTKTEIWIMWLPLLIIGVYELRGLFKRKRARSTPERTEGLSVIIPTLNAGAYLSRALESIRQSTVQPGEVIIADAGSNDETVSIAESFGAKVVHSDKGRGQQIYAGLTQSKHRYALILHADCQLSASGISSILNAFQADPHLVGGALGQRFDAQSILITKAEMLNEMRATLGGVAFGDQAQFFDTYKLPISRFPAQPLMEDVELSLRIIEQGRFLYLGDEVVSSSDKWSRGVQFRRFLQVILLVVRYRMARLVSPGFAEKFSHKLYKEYYSPRP